MPLSRSPSPSRVQPSLAIAISAVFRPRVCCAACICARIQRLLHPPDAISTFTPRDLLSGLCGRGSPSLALRVTDMQSRLLFGRIAFRFPAFPRSPVPVPVPHLAFVEFGDDERALERDRVHVAGDVAPRADKVAARAADEVAPEDERVMGREAGAMPDGRADDDDEAVPRAHAAVDAEVAPRERVPAQGLFATVRQRQTATWKNGVRMMGENEDENRHSPPP